MRSRLRSRSEAAEHSRSLKSGVALPRVGEWHVNPAPKPLAGSEWLAGRSTSGFTSAITVFTPSLRQQARLQAHSVYLLRAHRTIWEVLFLCFLAGLDCVFPAQECSHPQHLSLDDDVHGVGVRLAIVSHAFVAGLAIFADAMMQSGFLDRDNAKIIASTIKLIAVQKHDGMAGRRLHDLSVHVDGPGRIIFAAVSRGITSSIFSLGR